ncbi:MAG TPA: hypothetical protein VKL40_12860, partial [Candidatus Angelobacter sp.]|nr:hypothetical protein [Candidatus Angelobacter sp.]
ITFRGLLAALLPGATKPQSVSNWDHYVVCWANMDFREAEYEYSIKLLTGRAIGNHFSASFP